MTERYMKYLLIAAIVVVLSGCAGSREFGPYSGKIVDSETGEPIEGAVVFIQFSTKVYGSPGGPQYRTVNAIEALTNANGDFQIPRRKYPPGNQLIYARWLNHGQVIIFKPSYGVYPGHEGTSIVSSTTNGALPENEFVTIRLPQLTSVEERIRNLDNTSYVSAEVAEDKQKHLIRLRNIEFENLGLK